MAACSIAILITALACSGCIGAKTPPVSKPPAPAVFVDYYRTGGIAGLDDRLVIFDNGAAVVFVETTAAPLSKITSRSSSPTMPPVR